MFNNIPKVLHLYWDGSKMPFLCFMTAFSFRKLNPDWIIKIYSPVSITTKKSWITNEQKIEYEGKNYFHNLKDLENCVFITFDFETIGISNKTSEVQKSDFLRWHILSTEGGVWSDFDIIYFRRINEIDMTNQMLTTRNKEIDFSVCYDFNVNSEHKYSIGFLIAKKECQFYKKILKLAKENFNEIDYQGAGASIFNHEYPSLTKLYLTEKGSNIWNTSMDILYAYDSLKIEYIYKSNDLRFFTSNSIGLHWYYGSHITKKHINNFEKECLNYNILMKAMNKFKENHFKK